MSRNMNRKQLCHHLPAQALQPAELSGGEVDENPPQEKPAAVPRPGHPSGRPIRYKDQVGSVTELAAQAAVAPATMPPEPTHLPDFKDQVHGPPEPGSGNRSSNEKPTAQSNLPVVFAVEAQAEQIVLAENSPEVMDNNNSDPVPSDDADRKIALKQTMIRSIAAVVVAIVAAITVGVVLSLGGGSGDSPSQTTPVITTPSASPVASMESASPITLSPTKTPVVPPVPTLLPVLAVIPTGLPTSPPTLAPVPGPTLRPTAMPTRPPTPLPTPQPTARPTPQPTTRPTLQPTILGPTVKAFESTEELYQAVDNYMDDPALTAEYGATMNDWDVSRIQVFDRLFDGSRGQARYETSWCDGNFCTRMLFNEDLNQWNTSNAVSMNAMFNNAREFNGDISTWDVSRVTSMESLFDYARAFNRDLSQWNTGSVTSMHETFVRAYAFNQPIGNWNVARVTTTLEMFWEATSFNQDLSAWDVGAVTDAYGMFWLATALNQDLCAWRTKLPSTANVRFMFSGAVACPVDTSDFGVGSTPVLGAAGQYWCHECTV